MRYYLAIDGGGSKTEGLLLRGDGAVLSRAVVGASNPNDIGVAASGALLRGLCAELCMALPEGARVDRLFAGVSGAIGNSTLLEGALSSVADEVTVGSDAVNLLAMAGGDGAAALIAGTGSVCFARRDGILRRIGGWGYLLDGGGSGYDIGRDALAAVLRAHDGRGEATALTAALTDALGCTVAEAIPRIYREGKAFIASLAPLVFDVAAGGDGVASTILDRCADALAELVRAAADHLGGSGRVLMGGSLLTARGELVERLAMRVPEDVTLLRDDAPPVWGAFLEARRPTPDEIAAIRARFIDDYAKLC